MAAPNPDHYSRSYNKMETKLAEGTYFTFRFLSVLVGLFSIHFILIDLHQEEGLQPWLNGVLPTVPYITAAAFIALNLLLITGVIWTFDWMVIAWLAAYSITIPVGSLMLGLKHELPWNLGFPKIASEFFVTKSNLEPCLQPAVGLILNFINFLIVCLTVVSQGIFKSDQRTPILPATHRDVEERRGKKKRYSYNEIQAVVQHALGDNNVRKILSKMALDKDDGNKEVILPVMVVRSKSEGDY